ncbi:MAG: tetratricopeptide repeat protein [Planctomycetes bacterium]|nr:tetratricopeptide repeat protein [Planctomycetota bacterium]
MTLDGPGDPARAIDDATRALARDRSVSVLALLLRSEARLRQGDLEAALGDADAAVALAPDEAGPRRARGMARAALGDQPGAAADLRRFLERVSPDHPQAAEVRARLAGLGR